MKFGSVCSGIEAASVAWHPLGWKAAWLSEIEPFPSAVLAHHYPDVPNLGDMTTLPERILSGEVEAPDVFCGGTPCQAFSVAGLRNSLDDARGNLSLTFCEIANAIDIQRITTGMAPSVVFWENVPGVLSTKDNAFGCFLAGLAGEDDPLVPPGDKWANAGCVFGPQRAVAWRILDAQYFGLAQRRRRVFVVASARNGFDPAAVLFEFDGVRRDTAPSREAGEAAAGSASPGSGGSRHNSHWNGGAHPPLSQASQTRAGGIGGSNQEIFEQGGAGLVQAFGGNRTSGPIDVAPALNACGTASGRQDFESEAFLVQPTTHTLRGEGFDASEDGTGRGTPLVPVHREIAPTLTSNYGKQPDSSDTSSGPMLVPVAFDSTQITSAANRSNPKPGDPCHPLAAGAHAPAIAFSAKDYGADASQDLAPTLRAMNHADSHANGGGQMAVAFQSKQSAKSQAPSFDDVSPTLDVAKAGGMATFSAMQVRRLAPEECEALQGFDRGYTAIPWRKKPASECPDGPRYKALGNSWAVPNVRWIGQRIKREMERTC